MKIRLLISISISISVSIAAQTPAARIDSLMKSYYPQSDPGAVVAVVRDHALIFEKGYGLADLKSGMPVTADENFNIGSLTKQFTAFALLTLTEEGKCSLTDSIGKYFKLPQPFGQILLNQLLSHCSGLPDHYPFTDTSKVKHATDRDVLTAVRHADTLYFPSGSRYRYSNTAYCLLGLLIEKLSGLAYSEYLQQKIFKPLGISDARVFQYGKEIPHRVTGYEKNKEGKFVRSEADESIFFSTEADGGIYISMNNYLKWCEAVESGSLSRSFPILNAWQGHTRVDSARQLWYGYGWFVAGSGQSRTIYHTGFNGGFRTVVYMIPSINYCVTIFSNRGDIDLEELVSRINQIALPGDNSFIKSGPLESFIPRWPNFAPCKETSSYSTLFIRNLNAKGMVLN